VEKGLTEEELRVLKLAGEFRIASTGTIVPNKSGTPI
jgi:hypothetical protein